MRVRIGERMSGVPDYWMAPAILDNGTHEVPDRFWDRYRLAMAEWRAVQDLLAGVVAETTSHA